MPTLIKNKKLKQFILSQGAVLVGERVDAPASIGNSRARRSWINKFLSSNMEWGEMKSQCGCANCCLHFPNAKIKDGDFINPHI